MGHDSSSTRPAGIRFVGQRHDRALSELPSRTRHFSWTLLSRAAGQSICRTKPGLLAGVFVEGVEAGHTWPLSRPPFVHGSTQWLRWRSLVGWRPETARRSTTPNLPSEKRWPALSDSWRHCVNLIGKRLLFRDFKPQFVSGGLDRPLSSNGPDVCSAAVKPLQSKSPPRPGFDDEHASHTSGRHGRDARIVYPPRTKTGTPYENHAIAWRTHSSPANDGQRGPIYRAA